MRIDDHASNQPGFIAAPGTEQAVWLGRLVGEHVEGHGRQVMRPQGLFDAVQAVDDTASGRVDQCGPLLHPPQETGIDHAARFVGQGAVEAHDVCLFQQFIYRVDTTVSHCLFVATGLIGIIT